MMIDLLKPATRLLGRLRYAHKFLLIGILGLALLGTLLYQQYSELSRNLASADRELTGIAAIAPLSRLIQALQQHRDMSAAVFDGNADLWEPRARKEREVGELLAAADEHLTPALRAAPAWTDLRQRWRQLQRDGLHLAAADNLARHDQLIDGLLVFLVTVSDELHVTFDPQVDSYYLIDSAIHTLPLALERLSRLRSHGVGPLSRQFVTDTERIELGALVAEYEAALKRMRLNLDKTARYNPAIAAPLTAAAEDIRKSGAEVVGLVRSDIAADVLATPATDYFAKVTRVIDHGYQQLYDVLLPALRGLVEARAAHERQVLYRNAAISVVLTGLIVYFGLAVCRLTIGSLRRLTDGARTMAEGNLAVRIELDTQDELQWVGASFNAMAEAFGGFLAQVQRGAHQVLETSQTIAAASVQAAEASAQQSGSATEMAAAIHQMSTGVEHISRHARDAQALTSEAGRLSASGGETVHAVIAGIGKIAEAVSEAATVVEGLDRQSQKIASVVAVIREVAEQTNLLALNAAIEAARAGESGRGFAVVADEVRKLAERTATSTQEIATIVDAIRYGAGSAAASMRSGVDRVSEGVALAEQAGDAMHSIQDGARRVTDMVRDISTALHQQSTASQDVAGNVEKIAAIAEQNNGAAADNASTAQRLQALAAQLEGEARRFRTS